METQAARDHPVKAARPEIRASKDRWVLLDRSDPQDRRERHQAQTIRVYADFREKLALPASPGCWEQREIPEQPVTSVRRV